MDQPKRLHIPSWYWGYGGWKYLELHFQWTDQFTFPLNEDRHYKFLQLFLRQLPSGICKMRFRSFLESTNTKPRVGEICAKFIWELHNDVNERLEKPYFPKSEAQKQWLTPNGPHWKVPMGDYDRILQFLSVVKIESYYHIAFDHWNSQIMNHQTKLVSSSKSFASFKEIMESDVTGASKMCPTEQNSDRISWDWVSAINVALNDAGWTTMKYAFDHWKLKIFYFIPHSLDVLILFELPDVDSSESDKGNNTTLYIFYYHGILDSVLTCKFSISASLSVDEVDEKSYRLWLFDSSASLPTEKYVLRDDRQMSILIQDQKHNFIRLRFLSPRDLNPNLLKQDADKNEEDTTTQFEMSSTHPMPFDHPIPLLPKTKQRVTDLITSFKDPFFSVPHTYYMDPTRVHPFYLRLE